MARFSVDQADNYGGNGGGGYFSLKNDKDVARVRFMYNGIEDVEGFAVHEVKIGEKKRWVNCPREYGSPVDDCPFCKAGRFVNVKYFLQLYNIDEDKIQTWERGKKFGSKISSMCARYPKLVSHVFEIERNGKAGDMATTYEIFEVDKDDTTLEDLPETQDVLGGLVLDKSYDEMQYYIDYGEFPEDGNGGGDDYAPRRRGGDNYDDEPPFRGGNEPRRGDRGAERRTPARRGEAY